jgi:hypothetical protein
MDEWIDGWLRIKDISIKQSYNKFAKRLFRFLHTG